MFILSLHIIKLEPKMEYTCSAQLYRVAFASLLKLEANLIRAASIQVGSIPRFHSLHTETETYFQS